MRYWPENVDKEAVKYSFSRKKVGYADSIFVLINGQHFHIHEIKDPDYTLMLMTIFSTLEKMEKR